LLSSTGVAAGSVTGTTAVAIGSGCGVEGEELPWSPKTGARSRTVERRRGGAVSAAAADGLATGASSGMTTDSPPDRGNGDSGSIGVGRTSKCAAGSGNSDASAIASGSLGAASACSDAPARG
jgi:hypothetical protein